MAYYRIQYMYHTTRITIHFACAKKIKHEFNKFNENKLTRVSLFNLSFLCAKHVQ